MIVVVGMLTILTMDIFLIRMLSKIVNASLSSGTLEEQPRRSSALGNTPPMQLSQPSTSRLQKVPSVTEGTTRFFEPYRTPAEVEDKATAEKLKR